MKTSPVLERMEVGIPRQEMLISKSALFQELESNEILKKAQKLGYVLPSLRREWEKITLVLEQPKPLAAALRKAGVKPFTPESVAHYKAAKLKRKLQLFTSNYEEGADATCYVTSGWVINILLFIYIGSSMAITLHLPNLIYVSCIPVVAGVCVCLLCGIAESGALNLDEYQGAQYIVGFLLVLFIGSIIGLLEFFGPTKWEWQKISWKIYDKDIPLEIVATALEIDFHCSGVEFDVEYLTEKPDPFLIAKYNGEEYYLEVWGEPDFRGKRLA